MSHMCKRIFKFELQLGSYWQNIKFSRYCPKFLIFTKILIFKYICNFLDQLLHPYKFCRRDRSGILFFIFCQLWAVKMKLLMLITSSPIGRNRHMSISHRRDKPFIMAVIARYTRVLYVYAAAVSSSWRQVGLVNTTALRGDDWMLLAHRP